MRSQQLDKDKIKESLTIEDIKKVVLGLGGEFSRLDTNGNPSFSTICHGGDSHKLHYYDNSQSFHCYTRCGHLDVYQLVIDSKKQQGVTFEFPDALQYVAQLTGKAFTTERVSGEQNNIVKDFEWLNKFKRRPRRTAGLPTYDDTILELFMPYIHGTWYEEGISIEAADKYEISYYFTEDQIIIPHRDVEGNLVGLRSRNLDERANEGMKYMPTVANNIMFRHLVNFNLYGLNHTKEAISRFGKCMLFEGEKSVLKAYDLYGEDNFTVAVSGSNVSSHQVNMILSLGVREVFIAFDKFRRQREKESNSRYESALMAYQKKLLRIAHMFAPFCRVYILWDDEDLLEYSDAPIDQGEDVFLRLMRNKIEIRTQEGLIE